MPEKVTPFYLNWQFWLAIIAALVFFSDLPSKIRRWINKNRAVYAYQVKNSTDPLFHQALDLYERERRIPADEKAPRENIIRWVKESRTNSFFQRCRFIDNAVIAVDKGIPRGFAFVTHYKFKRKLFMSYVVAAPSQPPGQNLNASTDALFEEIRRLLKWRFPKCRYLISELDDPRNMESSPKQNLALARIRLFTMLAKTFSHQLCILNIPYIQPCLDPEKIPTVFNPDGNEGEKKLLLVFVPLRKRYDDRIQRSEAKKLIRFVLEVSYGESFITDPVLNKRFKNYLMALCDSIMNKLPTSVGLITFKDIKEEVRSKSSSLGCSGLAFRSASRI